jgi:pyruvate dehydrogenase E2 component (dihydrolipoamide acetyltransferase)
LIVPVIRDADLKGVSELAVEIEALAAAARDRTLRPDQMGGGTFTITNYGSRNGWLSTPLLRAPEIGIAGFGRYAQRPWVVDGVLAVRQVIPISVSVDHRIIDGDVAGTFNQALAELLNDPLLLLQAGTQWS